MPAIVRDVRATPVNIPFEAPYRFGVIAVRRGSHMLANVFSRLSQKERPARKAWAPRFLILNIRPLLLTTDH